MVRRVAKLYLLSALAASLLGCTSSKKEEENPNTFPTNYKTEILNTLTTTLDDPTNVRNASITEPAIRPAAKVDRYVVCIRFDARDVSRQYTGTKDRIAVFYEGHLDQLIDATKEQCGGVAYKPFPELEKLCQARKCE